MAEDFLSPRATRRVWEAGATEETTAGPSPNTVLSTASLALHDRTSLDAPARLGARGVAWAQGSRPPASALLTHRLRPAAAPQSCSSVAPSVDSLNEPGFGWRPLPQGSGPRRRETARSR